MFSAHLIFGDINDHSNIPFDKRVKVISEFWRICEHFRPINMNSHSFFETDNDMFTAGFSGIVEYNSGLSVLDFTIRLQKELMRHKIDVSFGVNLVACNTDISWKTYPGFINDINLMHMPDEIYKKIHEINRNRLTGDALITAARLLALAKKTDKKICFSTYKSGNIKNGDLDQLILKYNLNYSQVKDFSLLEESHNKWLAERKIQAFSLDY